MILFLHGKDTFRSRQKLAELRQKFFNEVDPQGYNLKVLSGNEATLEEIIDALNAAPFMASKRMVILEEYSRMSLSEKEEASLTEIAEGLLDSETIFAVWEEELNKTQRNQPFFKVLLKSKYVMPFENWNQAQVAGFMAQELRGKGLTITNDALDYLSLAVDDNMWLASSELNKLIHYARGADIQEIDKETVELLVSAGARDDIFALVDAVSQGDRKNAFKRLQEQLAVGSHELQIASMLNRQFRLLQQIKDGLEQGLSQDDIAKNYGIHPYVVKKMSGQAQKIAAEDISRAYNLINQLDATIKSSGLDPAMLLNKTVAELCR